MTNLQPVSGDQLTFEDFKNDNGMTFWWASHLAEMLGYSSTKSFQKAVDRGIRALMSLDISIFDNVQQHTNQGISDYKLTRFACYMIVMNSDPKKQQVAHAQAYFASTARKFELIVQKSDDIERLIIRDDVKEGNKALSDAAKHAGVIDYAKFTNAGYLGLYNMNNWQLSNRRGIKKQKLFDNMGRTELAANLFRITMTEERIKNKGVKGQNALEKTHKEVGREIRRVVIKNTGTNPENLPQKNELPAVKKELKKTYREMKKKDKK